VLVIQLVRWEGTGTLEWRDDLYIYIYIYIHILWIHPVRRHVYEPETHAVATWSDCRDVATSRRSGRGPNNTKSPETCRSPMKTHVSKKV